MRSADHFRASFVALPGAARATRSPDEPGRVRTSVLVNTYNHASYIDSCLASLLDQTQPPDEIVVYDDGSSDDTVRRLARFGRRITVIHGMRQHRPGYLAQAHAIYSAFLRSHGDLIFLLDGDDCFLPDKIEHYVRAFQNEPDIALVQAPMLKVDEHGTPLGSSFEPRKHISHHLNEIYRRQDVDFYYPTSALAFSRSYLDRRLPLDCSDGLPLWSDTRLGIVAPFFGKIVTLSDCHSLWRRHSHSDSIRARSRTLQIRQTLMRMRVFNRFCESHGLPTIQPWRNGRLYRQMLRCGAPNPLFSFYYNRLRPVFARLENAPAS